MNINDYFMNKLTETMIITLTTGGGCPRLFLNNIAAHLYIVPGKAWRKLAIAYRCIYGITSP